MIKSIIVKNYVDDTMVMELSHPEKTGFNVQSVSGLGPVKASINMTGIATVDGAIYNSAHAENRNITMKLQFWETFDIEDLRHKSYKYFPLKKKVTLTVITDKRELTTYGYVESNEPEIFSEKEGTDISIICQDAFFELSGSGSETVTNFSNINPLFEFEFSNESLTQPLIEFSMMQETTEQVIQYIGDTDTGMIIRLDIKGEFSGFKIFNADDASQFMALDSERIKSAVTAAGGTPFAADDWIIISTTAGDKRAEYWSNGKKVNILNSVDRGSSWPQVTIGDNRFVFVADEGGTGNISVQVTNKTLFEGV